MELKWIEFVKKSRTIPWDYDIYEICIEQTAIGRMVFRYGSSKQLRYCGQIGYHIETDYRGHGYAYQALCLLLDQLKEKGIERVTITCAKDNVASQKTIEKTHVLHRYLETQIDDPEYRQSGGLWIYEIGVSI